MQSVRGATAGLLLWSCCAVPQFTKLDAISGAAFERLKALQGPWQATNAKGDSVQVSFRSIAGASALVETYVSPSGTETLTIFHRDADRLLATHYCGLGNQPRLSLEPRSTPDHLVFRFLDATNLPDPARAHLVELELWLKGPNYFGMTETYEEAGQRTATKLSFSPTPGRAQPSQH